MTNYIAGIGDKISAVLTMASEGKVIVTVVLDQSAFAYCVFDKTVAEEVFREHVAARGRRLPEMRRGGQR